MMLGWTCNTCGKEYWGEDAATALKEHAKAHGSAEGAVTGMSAQGRVKPLVSKCRRCGKTHWTWNGAVICNSRSLTEKESN